MSPGGSSNNNDLARHVPRLSPRIAMPLAAMVLAYFASAAGALYAFGESTPIWFPNAIAVVALLRQPLRTWPLFVAGAWAADALAVSLFGHGVSLLVTAADVLEMLLVATAIQASGGVRQPLFEGGVMLRILAACLLAPLASSALGALIVGAGLGVPFEQAFHTWYSASALGLVIVVPFLLSWLDEDLRASALARVGRRDLLLLAAGALCAAALLQLTDHRAGLFFTFPIVLALTWAYGLVGASVGMLAIAFASVWSTVSGQGALIGMSLPSTDIGERIEGVQMYLAAVLLSSLPLALLHAKQRGLAARLQRTGEARTEFLAAMSHEIRTPMTGVLGMADLLGAEDLTSRQRSYVEAMRSSGRHLLSIINDVLDFSRIESGRLELEDVDFALHDMVERLRSIVHPLAVERGLELRMDVRFPPACVLRGDPLRLRQALLNLVSNGIKFTERGRVELVVMERSDPATTQRWVRMEVRDTGVGIEPAKLQQLFAPFTQADRSISRQYGGSGLGLAISKRLVEAMGGSIAVSSVPGQGSIFTIEVPLREGDAAQVQPEGSETPAAVPPLRILVAEDVEINREILRTALTRNGHALTFATDGAQAWRLVQRQPFDVVLMDVQMPVMDGVEATRRIRTLPPPLGQVPILGLTANVMARERERYLAAGMDDCLAKPIDWDALHKALARVAGEGEPVQSAAAPSPVPAAGLLEENAIGALRHMAGEAQIGELMRIGMQGYEDACNAMADDQANAEVLGLQAHRLKGSSGTLGLSAISALAAEIEAAAERGEAARHLVPQLRETIRATRAELVRRGLLAGAAS